MGMKKMWEEKKTKTIKKWKKEARLKNKRTLQAIPFDNIKCSKCGQVMNYRWSMLHEEIANSVSKVMFFYRCSKQCEGQIIFEDGTPWLSKEDDKCAICKGERNSTITKDNTGSTYIIYECKKCGGRQVEKYSH